ncbi:MAG: hypothetical protein AABX25_05000 [Nanoarchaeota archaeon]
MIPALDERLRTNRVLTVNGVDLQISAVADLGQKVAAVNLFSLRPHQPITPEIEVKVIKLLGYDVDGFRVLMSYHTG